MFEISQRRYLINECITQKSEIKPRFLRPFLLMMLIHVWYFIAGINDCLKVLVILFGGVMGCVNKLSFIYSNAFTNSGVLSKSIRNK